MHLKKENLASDVLKNTLERLVIIFFKAKLPNNYVILQSNAKPLGTQGLPWGEENAKQAEF